LTRQTHAAADERAGNEALKKVLANRRVKELRN
jgi:hypothetical protein